MKDDVKRIESYIEKIYGYAVNRTFNRDEADELAQEILFTAVREFPKLKNPQKLEPWLWGIAANVTKTFRRFLGRQRAMCSYDLLADLPAAEDDLAENEEIYAFLRSKIAMLSAIYREIILLYYYDGLSVKQIAGKLGIPEGTVTWRLSEARTKLKKECIDMTETALKPVKLEIRISGSGEYNGAATPFPQVYISDALSQNILYYCYKKAKSVEELAKLCGVPAYYVEDSLRNLLYREAVSALPGGKFRTEFMIYDDSVSEYAEQNGGIFQPLLRDFVESLKKLTEETLNIPDLYRAGKEARELLYLYGILALNHLQGRYNPVQYTAPPLRYNGFRWSYHAHLANGVKYPVSGLGSEASLNLGSRGTYAHYSYHFNGFDYRPMMGSGAINVCEDVLRGRAVADHDAAAAAIASGYMTRCGEEQFTVNVPAFTMEQKAQFDRLSEDCFAGILPDYAAAVRRYTDGYRKLFPPHLEEDVTRACSALFVTLYATQLCKSAQKNNLLEPPAPGSVCDVLIGFK